MRLIPACSRLSRPSLHRPQSGILTPVTQHDVTYQPLISGRGRSHILISPMHERIALSPRIQGRELPASYALIFWNFDVPETTANLQTQHSIPTNVTWKRAADSWSILMGTAGQPEPLFTVHCVTWRALPQFLARRRERPACAVSSLVGLPEIHQRAFTTIFLVLKLLRLML